MDFLHLLKLQLFFVFGIRENFLDRRTERTCFNMYECVGVLLIKSQFLRFHIQITMALLLLQRSTLTVAGIKKAHVS